jgi:hypothetical protein
MWESQCPYIRCEQIDSMLEDGVCIPRPYAHTVRALAASIAVECFARCVSPSRQDQRLRHEGCGGFKRDRVASHAKTFQPKEQGTRDLGVLFEEGLRKERERMIALIKEAYWLAYEGMQMQKFYSLNPAVVASECHRATRPTAAPRYSVRSIAIAQSRQTLNLWLACMHVPEFKAGRDWRMAQRFQYKWHEGVARGRAQPHALRHAAYVVLSSERSALRGWSHL